MREKEAVAQGHADKPSRLNVWRVAVTEGFFELALITILVLFNEGASQVLIAGCIAAELLFAIARKSDRRQVRLLAVVLIVLQLLSGRSELKAPILALCLSIGFTHQNTFQCGLFAIVLAQAVNLSAISPLVHFLFGCIEMQVYIVAGAMFISPVNHKSLAYRGLLLFNCISAITAFYPFGLHAQIVQSPHFLDVFLYGSVGILGLAMLALVVSRIPGIPNIARRKMFHLPPFFMFPFLNHEIRPLFLVALAGSFYVLVVLELLRYHHDPIKNYAPAALQAGWNWMKGFIDKRDQHLWVTHLSLFAGMMTSYYSTNSELIQNSAVVLPIGDACAAIIGSAVGRIKISGKSIEGSLAFVAGTYAGYYILARAFSWTFNAGIFFVPVVLSAAFELFSRQIDNLSLPVLFLQLVRMGL